ncbi:MAG: hypothetical protein EHM27_05010 [Deltaproteobacteria bacterium]|nr:MAG: hypothetical protein EHM27_05010 [Deltaproteobacteria bacterium]
MEPGMAQLGAMLLLMAGTVGIVFSIQAKFSEKRGRDVLIRLVLAGFALIVIFHPNTRLAVMAILPIGLFVGYWVLQHRKKQA